jgi:hypothetical protein
MLFEVVGMRGGIRSLDWLGLTVVTGIIGEL